MLSRVRLAVDMRAVAVLCRCGRALGSSSRSRAGDTVETELKLAEMALKHRKIMKKSIRNAKNNHEFIIINDQL